MLRDSSFLYKKIKYPLDPFMGSLRLPPSRIKSESDPLLELILGESYSDLEPGSPFEPLDQIEFAQNGEIFLFPDFDNICSRPESVRDWWFLQPDYKGKDIYQSEEDINTWWEKFQKIYNSSILKKKEAAKTQILFTALSMSNFLVNSLLSNLFPPPIRIAIDKSDLIYPRYYCYRFFCDNNIKEKWQFWILQKGIVNYYHIIFAPDLLESPNDREILRLSNRFPEYARANNCLSKFRQDLYKGNFHKRYVDEFFEAQSIELKNTIQARKQEIGQVKHISFGQCRVCGALFPRLKVIKNRQGGGKIKKTCSLPDCEKVWEVFRKSLPPNPHDEEGGIINISCL